MSDNTYHIIGCGATAAFWDGQGHSIGVNDCFKYHPVESLVLVNTPNKFSPDRMQVIRNSEPEKVYAHNAQWKSYFPKMQLIQPKQFLGRLRRGDIYHANTSPFVAMSIAFNQGAKELILWGVDFKTHRFMSPGSGYLKAELNAYESLINALERNGCSVFLGSEESELNKILPVWKVSV